MDCPNTRSSSNVKDALSSISPRAEMRFAIKRDQEVVILTICQVLEDKVMRQSMFGYIYLDDHFLPKDD